MDGVCVDRDRVISVCVAGTTGQRARYPAMGQCASKGRRASGAQPVSRRVTGADQGGGTSSVVAMNSEERVSVRTPPPVRPVSAAVVHTAVAAKPVAAASSPTHQPQTQGPATEPPPAYASLKTSCALGVIVEDPAGPTVYPTTEPTVLHLNDTLERAMESRLTGHMPPAEAVGILFKTLAVFKTRAAAARHAVKHREHSVRMKRRPSSLAVPLSPKRQSMIEAEERAAAATAAAAADTDNSHATREGAIAAGVRLLEKRLAHNGMRSEQMADDGNCQFRAVSHQLYGCQDYHFLVRQRACDRIEADRVAFAMYFEDDAEFEEYVLNMRQDFTWGDELTLKAISDEYGVIVNLITSQPTNWFMQYKAEVLVKPAKRIFICYIAPIHYNSVVNISDRLDP
eukprot:m.94943 g.94943  ORF g.94943 m.94943 type:complete len:399 (+) comp15136_c1_seq2:202-1398(+)